MTDATDVVEAANGAALEVLHFTRPRFKSVPLQWPIEYAGKTYTEVQIVRLTAKEVADWVEGIKGREKEEVRIPIFRDADGLPIPDAVLDGLDDDDRLALDEAALDFLPRRFRAAPASASGPADGAITAPSSPA